MTEQATGTPFIVSVRGEATLEVDPELCEFAVTVMARGKDRRAALDQLTSQNKQLLDTLKSEYGDALERLETGLFSVYPESRLKRGDRAAYQGSVRTRVVVKDFTVLGEMVTKVADLVRSSVNGPYWSLRPDSEAYRRARGEAVDEAVRRAREYAAALGSTLTAVLELADTGMSHHGLMPMAPQARVMTAVAGPGGAPDSGPAPLDLEPVRQSVYAAVEARFSATQPERL